MYDVHPWYSITIGHEIFVNDLFRRKLNAQNILCNVHRPIPVLVAKVWRRKLDYAKILQVKYFAGENIPIYGTSKLPRDDVQVPFLLFKCRGGWVWSHAYC